MQIWKPLYHKFTKLGELLTPIFDINYLYLIFYKNKLYDKWILLKKEKINVWVDHSLSFSFSLIIEDCENSFWGRMALRTEVTISLLGLKSAYLPEIKLYFTSPALICSFPSLWNKVWVSITSSPSFTCTYSSRLSSVLPITLFLSSTSYKNPLLTPSGTLKLYLWSAQVGGFLSASGKCSVSRHYSPIVNLLATLSSPQLPVFLLIVAS